MEKRQLRIEVLGTSFTIQSDESTEHLTRLSSYVKSKIEEVKARYTFADPLTIAVLAALNIADDLFKARQARSASAGEERTPADKPAESRGEGEEISEVAERLITKIDDELLEHTPWEEDPHVP
jgi:cell division protein ZapA